MRGRGPKQRRRRPRAGVAKRLLKGLARAAKQAGRMNAKARPSVRPWRSWAPSSQVSHSRPAKAPAAACCAINLLTQGKAPTLHVCSCPEGELDACVLAGGCAPPYSRRSASKEMKGGRGGGESLVLPARKAFIRSGESERELSLLPVALALLICHA